MDTATLLEPITVPMPMILNILVPKRMPVVHSRQDGCTNVPISFYPPKFAAQWPKKIGDIDDSELKFVLKWGGTDAVGSKFLRL